MNETAGGETISPTIPNVARFWIFLTLLIPATIGCLWILYHLFISETLRKAPKNHVAILLLSFSLITQLTVIPGMLYFYHVDGVWERPILLCQFWGFIDWTCYGIQVILVAYGSIERHILIFHNQWISTKTKLFIFHYLPLCFLIVYEILFYLFVFFFPPCGEFYTIEEPVCVDSCFMFYPEIATYDSIAHQILPPFVLSFFNILLIVRVIRQKSRFHQRIEWRKHRKMAVQFFILSSIFVICSTPYAIDTMFYYTGITYKGQSIVSDYLTVITYFPQLSMPFTFGLSVSEIRRKVCRFFIAKRTMKIVPIVPAKTNFQTLR